MDDRARTGWEGGGESLPRIVCVDLRREGERVSATAHLEQDDRSGRGRASALATRGNLLRVAAEATLQAAADLNGDLTSLHLEGLRIVAIDGIRVVLAHLVLLEGGVERDLVGCGLVRSESWEAAAAAVLDAVGRLPLRRAPLALVTPDDDIEYEVGEDEA